MNGQIQQTKKGYCKNLYCNNKLVGFDEGKDFCIRCRNGSWKEIKWLCTICRFNVLSTSTNSIRKMICDDCFTGHVRKATRNSYLKRKYRASPEEYRMFNIYRVDYQFRLNMKMFDVMQEEACILGVCKHCYEPIRISLHHKNRKFCSNSCKVANYAFLKRFAKAGVKFIESCMSENQLYAKC